MSDNGKFIGHYVDEMVLVMTAAAVSNQHAMFIGVPGCGKTAIVRSGANRIYGDGSIFIRLNPTTPPEVMVGVVDPAGVLQSPPVWEYDRTGTALDPDAQNIVLDEAWRASDAVADIYINILDRQDDDNPDEAPTVWATANFLPTTERTEAVLDRFPFYYWVPNEVIPLPEAVRSHLTSLGRRLEIDAELPTLQQTLDVQSATPTKNSIKAIAETIAELEDEVAKGLLDSNGKPIRMFDKPNMRRRMFWSTMLFRASVYFGGIADFTEVHEKATTALAWSQILRSPEEANDWKTLTGALADPMGMVIDSIMKSTYVKMQECSDEYPNDPVTAAAELGKHVQVCLEKIQQYVEDGDERFGQAAFDLQDAVHKLVSGKKIVGG